MENLLSLAKSIEPDVQLLKVDVSDMDATLLREDGSLNILSAEYFHEQGIVKTLNFMHKHAIYVMPTSELIAWLSANIEFPAIEIGAGNGAIARSLGIPATDSYQQEEDDRKFLYALLGAPTVRYGHDVIKMDAEDAVDHYKPHTVIGAYISHKCWPHFTVAPGCGNANGVEEEYILKRAKRYIMIGNQHVHRTKPILKLPHDELQFPWLVCRAHKPELNTIFVWDKV